MITIEPVVTIGELLGPAVVAVVGTIQCLLIFYGIRQMSVASKERSRQLDAVERRIEQQGRQFEQRMEQRDRQFEQRASQFEQRFEQQGKALEDIGAGIREAAAGIRELLQERQERK